MSSLGTSYRCGPPSLATIATAETVGALGATTVSKVTEMLTGYAARNLRAGLTVRKHVMDIAGIGGVPDMRVQLTRTVDDSPPTVASSHQRARVFFVKGTCDGDILKRLRDSDGPVKGAPGFRRDSHRLDKAIEKASRCERPNIALSNYQLKVPLGFGPETVGDERPYRPVLVSQLRGVYDKVADTTYRIKSEEAIDLGDYTHHDPDTLHPRFLEYVHNRTTEVDAITHESMREAKAVMAKHWSSLGLNVKARPLSDAVPEVFGAEITAGSQGEYRVLGATSRNDERLVLTLCDSLLRYGEAGRQAVRSGRLPDFVHTTQQPSGMFGKNERKAAKYKEGERVTPVPRCIFNVSPVDWTLAKFLHGHLSEFLSENDPLHGPGYGPNRGRAWKLLRLLDKAYGEETVNGTFRLSMSDIEKWDANMCEYLLVHAFDLLESAVDCSGLSAYNKAARAAMVSVARRHLLEKLVEHPSGYFVHMYGCMPSGSYYTSLLNTIGNNLLVISLVIKRLMVEKGLSPRVARARVQPHIDGRLLSYGDNQIVSEELFIAVGLTYDPVVHASHLACFGMTLKIDETEVSNKLGRARFCSRACVQTPKGKLLLRTHTSLYGKIAGTPDVEPMVFKLWLRATAIDHMGTDPIVYNLLKRIDSMVRVTGVPSMKTRAVRDVLENLCQKFMGNTNDESMEIALSVLNRSFPTRAALLSLHTALAGGMAHGKLGTALLFDDGARGFELTPAAQWALDQTEDSWLEYLRSTDQMGVLTD
ncbi:putative RNA-dependent-RNA-polymerase [Penicillium janthinellum polymycovirus 1]|nr:putative RNA-dependent-RNA-polymerase [Penicillium janthinellum polymycovirus 1]